MTSEERAAALRDIVYETVDEHGVVITKDLVIEREVHTDGNGLLHRTYRARERYRVDAQVWLAKTYDICETVYLARQKLAAEREAAMTPNERKYKAALERIALGCGTKPWMEFETAASVAKEALKEST